MEGVSLFKKSLMRKKFFYAFPGMGKTPLALNQAGWFDADFGFFREAFKVQKSNEVCLLKPYVRFVRLTSDQGFKVLINEPKVMQFLNSKDSVCILPVDPRFSARKMKVDVETVKAWTAGWADTAKQFHIQVLWITTGLDEFLK